MAGNSLAYITGYVTRESLRTLEGSIAFAKHVRRDLDKYYAKTGAKIGYTVNLRVPPIYSVTTGPNLSLQDTVETTLPVTLTNQDHVDIYFQNSDLVLEVDDFYKRFVKQAVVRLASQIDYNGLLQWKNVNSAVGTPGTPPTTQAVPLAARQKLNENLAPIGERALVYDPSTEASLTPAFTSIFNPQALIGAIVKEGSLEQPEGPLGFQWQMDQQVAAMISGANAGTITVKTAPASGATTITLTGFAASTSNVVNQGEVFSISTVHNINAQTKQAYAALKQFVVTSTGNNSNATGDVTLTISPALNDSATGGAQNIDALPAATNSVTLFSGAAKTSPQSLAFHREAFALVAADLELAGYGDIDSRFSDPDVGLSISIKRIYDINTDKKPCRLDVLYGWATPRPEFAVRVAA